jgi:hypothetical protein
VTREFNINQKFLRISDFFFEELKIKKTKFGIQHLLRNNGKDNLRIDTKLPKDIKVVKLLYSPVYCACSVLVESDEFSGEQDEIILTLTRIAYDEYRAKEMVSFT